MNEKIYFISLGCDKNRVDAEMMCHRLESAGYGITADLSEADAAIVNTCGFISSAKEEAIENIFDMVREKEAGNLRALIVTGCLSERNGEEMAELIPEIDAIAGIGQNGDIVSIVRDALEGKKCPFVRDPLALPLEGERLLSTPQHYAYLKIADGCDNRCTYCAIPGIRGKYRSRPVESILAEARKLVSYGVRELILVAQDTTSYGSDLGNGENLTSLLKKLAEIEGIWKIRILYAYPERITEELIDEIANEEKIAKYIDVPLQHADSAVLRRMGRFGSGEENLALIRKLRQRIPGLTVRSTFIAGFPGETREQFNHLLDFVREAGLDRAGCFAYSEEEGTPAARMKGQNTERTKQRRAADFYRLQSAATEERQAEKIGTRFEAICDGYSEERGMFLLRGESDTPEDDCVCLVPLSEDLLPGEVYELECLDAEGPDLICTLAPVID